MTRSLDQKLIDFLKGVSDFFENTTNENNKNFCSKHRVEHIGKTAYSIGVDLYLFETLKDEEYFKRAHKRALRVVDRLFRVGEMYVYLHDGHERWNMSQRVIDAGAATDMLATFLQKVGSKLNESDYKKISDAVRKNANTYLTIASIDKAPTNQRLWGATGLASAYKLFGNDEWLEALKKSLDRSFSEMREDGSIPYVTAYKGYMSETACEVTPYYHSRHLVFAWHVIDVLPNDCQQTYLPQLLKGTDFLIGMHQSDGIKSMALETKHWYFLSQYEVASNSYDSYAFLRAYETTKDYKYLQAGLRSLSLLLEHQLNNGSVIDHYGDGNNFQCTYFWTSHTAWLTRISYLVKKNMGVVKEELLPNSIFFEKSGIVNIKTPESGLMVRGAKAPYGFHMGPKIGGGSIIYLGFKGEEFRNIVFCKYTEKLSSANWHAYRKRNLFDFEHPTIQDGKALFYYSLIELRGFRFKGFVERLKVLFYTLSWSHHISSQYCTAPKIELKENKVIVSDGALCYMNGHTVDHVLVTRKYKLHLDYLSVEENLSGSFNSELFYQLPEGAQIISTEPKPSKKRGNRLHFQKLEKKIILNYSVSTKRICI